MALEISTKIIIKYLDDDLNISSLLILVLVRCRADCHNPRIVVLVSKCSNIKKHLKDILDVT